MRNRDHKNSFSGGYYHAYNRGNAKQNIFLDDDDYRFFLLRLRQNIKPNGKEPRHFRPLPPNSFTLISYCLMPNHFHLHIRQNGDTPTSTLVGKVCTSYSMYFNRKYERVGHVFQDQFKQTHIDDDRYFLWLSSYIHLNPVKAGIVKNVGIYPWSSIREYIGEGEGEFCDTKAILERFEKNPKEQYLEYLNDGFSNDDVGVDVELRMDDM